MGRIDGPIIFIPLTWYVIKCLLEKEVDQEFCNGPVSSKEWFGDFSLKRLPLNHIGILTIALSHTQDHIKTQKKPSAQPTLQSTAFLVSWIHTYIVCLLQKKPLALLGNISPIFFFNRCITRCFQVLWSYFELEKIWVIGISSNWTT